MKSLILVMLFLTARNLQCMDLDPVVEFAGVYQIPFQHVLKDDSLVDLWKRDSYWQHREQRSIQAPQSLPSSTRSLPRDLMIESDGGLSDSDKGVEIQSKPSIPRVCLPRAGLTPQTQSTQHNGTRSAPASPRNDSARTPLQRSDFNLTKMEFAQIHTAQVQAKPDLDAQKGSNDEKRILICLVICMHSRDILISLFMFDLR